MANNKVETNNIKEVPYLMKDYPKPKPPPSKKNEIFDPNDYADIDQRVTHTPAEKMTSFTTLVEHLTYRLATDLQKVRAIFSWIGNQNTLDTKYPHTTDPYTPNAYLKAIQDSSAVYTKLFAILCREANIPCVILTGRARAGSYQVGDTDEYFSTWNAVYVESGWRLVHCNWAFLSIVGRKAGGWLKIEEDGQNVREEIKESTGTAEHASTMKESWFLTDPEIFIYFCRPADDNWQLLRSRVSLTRFLSLPFIRPSFTESHLSFKAGQEGTVMSHKGTYNLIIKTNNPHIQLKYELLYKTDSGPEFPNNDGADRYVAMATTKEEAELMFRVIFPIEGIYKLSLYRKRSYMIVWLCDFKLVCKERKYNCNPLPVNPDIGWGLGPTAKKEGIYEASHNEGIIESRDGKHLELFFKYRGKQKFVPSLKHTGLPDSVTDQFITSSIKHNSVIIKLRPEDGEYALIIDSYKKGVVKNVLNYIIESGQPDTRRDHARENATEKAVRQQLKEASRGRNKDDLITVIEKFKKLRMEDKGHLAKAQQALERLEVKERLKFALMRERSDELEKAIHQAETSSVAQKVQPEVERARTALNELMLRNTTPRAISAVNKKNVAEIRAIRCLTVPLRDVFTAVFIILGEHKDNLEDGYMLGLLKRTGPESLLNRLERFEPTRVKPAVMRTASRLLGRYQEEKIGQICPPARKVYQEGMKCVNKYKRTRSPSIRNDPREARESNKEENLAEIKNT